MEKDKNQNRGIISENEREGMEQADKSVQDQVDKDLKARKGFKDETFAPENVQGTEDKSEYWF